MHRNKMEYITAHVLVYEECQKSNNYINPTDDAYIDLNLLIVTTPQPMAR
jgi:hypothetical protein